MILTKVYCTQVSHLFILFNTKNKMYNQDNYLIILLSYYTIILPLDHTIVIVIYSLLIIIGLFNLSVDRIRIVRLPSIYDYLIKNQK